MLKVGVGKNMTMSAAVEKMHGLPAFHAFLGMHGTAFAAAPGPVRLERSVDQVLEAMDGRYPRSCGVIHGLTPEKPVVNLSRYEPEEVRDES